MRQNLVVALRVAALIVLLTAAVAAATAAHPREASYEDFRRDVERGSVTRVIIPKNQWTQDSVRTGIWSTGPFRWKQGTVVDTPPWEMPEWSTRSTSDTAGPSPWSTFANDMRARGVDLDRESDDGPTFIAWPLRTPEWFSLLVSLTWLATFAVMLTSTPRWGNRWAWFWMFVIGQIGVILYLIFEPRPFVRFPRRRRPDGPPGAPEPYDEPAPPRPRRDGAQGCLLSLLAAIVAAAASAGVGWLVGFVLP